MRIYQGVSGRGGVPYGEQASFTLMKAAGDEEAAKEPETMEPEAEIPTEEPTAPEPIEEPVAEATPEEPEPEAPSEEPTPEPEPEPEPVVEEEAPTPPEPVVEEEPKPTEEEAPPPEPEETGVNFTFSPESPYLTDGVEPLIVNGQVTGIVEPATTRFYINIVRKGDNGTTIPVVDTPLNPEGDRTATTHSLVSNLQAF